MAPKNVLTLQVTDNLYCYPDGRELPKGKYHACARGKGNYSFISFIWVPHQLLKPDYDLCMQAKLANVLINAAEVKVLSAERRLVS